MKSVTGKTLKRSKKKKKVTCVNTCVILWLDKSQENFNVPFYFSYKHSSPDADGPSLPPLKSSTRLSSKLKKWMREQAASQRWGCRKGDGVRERQSATTLTKEMRKPHSKWQAFLSLTHCSRLSTGTSAAYKYVDLLQYDTQITTCVQIVALLISAGFLDTEMQDFFFPKSAVFRLKELC